MRLLLMKRILAVAHHGARLIETELLLMMMRQLLPMVRRLLLVHGLMGWHLVVMWKLRYRRAVH